MKLFEANHAAGSIVRTLVVFLALLQGISAATAQELRSDSVVRNEAINLLQNKDTRPFLDTARVTLVASALSRIREWHPQLSDIGAGPDRSYLVLLARDSAAAARLVAGTGAHTPRGLNRIGWRTVLDSVEISVIDSLNRVYHVDHLELYTSMGFAEIRLYFEAPVNIPVVRRAYQLFPWLDANHAGYGGDWSWISLTQARRKLHFLFSRGTGDCMAGCSHRDFYHVTYDIPTRAVVLDKQSANGPVREPIAY